MSYLDEEKMNAFIHEANIRQIAKIWIYAAELVSCWGFYTLEDFFQTIDNYIPKIYEFIDIDKIKSRAKKIREDRLKEKPEGDTPQIHEYLPIGFKAEVIEDVVPEVTIIRDRFQEAFVSIPSGVKKTEAWLYPYALKSGADADLEALIYFKSQGESLVSSDEVSENWRNAICIDVERDSFINKNKKSTIKKAKNKELSFMELADLLNDSNYFPDFLSARDEEEDFITPTFFRVVEWFQLNEFDPWINAYAQEISTAYQSGVDEVYSLFPLFYLCRSDLLIRKASKFGLEALLYGICVGKIESAKPWKRYWAAHDEDDTNRIIVDYIPTASIIAFAWQRINPTNINFDVLDKAMLLLFQSQLASGGWPLTSRHTNGDILSTYLAMIALGVNKPEGYQRYLDKAKEWLLNQQNEVGCWYIQGGPTLMINVLCLEAIRLSEGINQITFNIQEKPSGINKTVVRNQSENYIVFCEGNSTGTKNKSFDEKCYEKIFSSEFPNAIFFSVGSCTDIESDKKQSFDMIKKINPYHNIIKLLDRDDRSIEEIEELKMQGITVLSLRELESYLLEDEIINKLCIVCGKQNKLDEILEIKTQALKDSINRGNPADDLKSASGQFFTNSKKSLGLIKCGNDRIAFLRDTMAPLITQETSTYKLLRKDIFNI